MQGTRGPELQVGVFVQHALEKRLTLRAVRTQPVASRPNKIAPRIAFRNLLNRFVLLRHHRPELNNPYERLDDRRVIFRCTGEIEKTPRILPAVWPNRRAAFRSASVLALWKSFVAALLLASNSAASSRTAFPRHWCAGRIVYEAASRQQCGKHDATIHRQTSSQSSNTT